MLLVHVYTHTIAQKKRGRENQRQERMMTQKKTSLLVCLVTSDYVLDYNGYDGYKGESLGSERDKPARQRPSDRFGPCMAGRRWGHARDCTHEITLGREDFSYRFFTLAVDGHLSSFMLHIYMTQLCVDVMFTFIIIYE